MNVSTSSFKSSSHLSNSSQLALGKKSLQTPQPLKEVPEQVLDVLNGDSSAHSSVFQLPSPVKDEVREKSILPILPKKFMYTVAAFRGFTFG